MSLFRADLHVHTDASPDGRSPLAAIARAARRAGLDAVAVTDHDLCTPVPETLEGVLLIPGCEVSTAAGHVTGLFLERPLDLAALGRLPPPEEAAAAIRAAGGLAVLAHPYHRPGAAPEQFTFPLDGIEAVNARACFKVPDANRRAAALAGQRGLPQAGGSDAHDAAEVGNAFTELEAEALTLPALRAALAAGRSRAVKRRDTPRLRKGLSQWTKALRAGGVRRVAVAAAYVVHCGGLDICAAARRKG